MKYERLTTDQQKAMLEERLAALEREHFNNVVAEANDKAAGGDGKQFADNQKTIDKVYDEVKKQLGKL